MFDRQTYRSDPRNAGRCWDLNHRWRRADYLVNAGKRPSTTRDDAITRQAWTFLRALRRWRKGAIRPPLPDDFPAIRVAYDCFCFLAPLQRAEVEARLLAGQADDAIAARCAIRAEVVGVFHDLFYDVRPYRGDRAVIAQLALRWWPVPGDADHAGALKLFGYSLGGRAVDALLQYVVAPSETGAGAEVASGVPSHKGLWERLFGRARALALRTWDAAADRLPSLVALLREEGAGLVAEGVEVPVPPRPVVAPVASTCMWRWRSAFDEEPLLVYDDDAETD